MVHQYNSTTYGSVYRCTTVVLPNPLLVNRAPELTDFALQIALPHFMRIFLGRVLAHYHSTEHGLSVTTIYDRLLLWSWVLDSGIVAVDLCGDLDWEKNLTLATPEELILV